MIAHYTDRPSKDTDPTVPTDPVCGSIAARCSSTHQVRDETGTVGSVGTVPRTVPVPFARFAEPSQPTADPNEDAP